MEDQNAQRVVHDSLCFVQFRSVFLKIIFRVELESYPIEFQLKSNTFSEKPVKREFSPMPETIPSAQKDNMMKSTVHYSTIGMIIEIKIAECV